MIKGGGKVGRLDWRDEKRIKKGNKRRKKKERREIGSDEQTVEAAAGFGRLRLCETLPDVWYTQLPDTHKHTIIKHTRQSLSLTHKLHDLLAPASQSLVR